ncbi:hypothetical protein ABZ614_11225 [Streptomyces sp. NPDC013178]|uniref:hypothetical protein n=1 Tax=Streptomyces sp. NPDC013178 TaxID=3155118 RepID=UPI0033C1B2F5
MSAVEMSRTDAVAVVQRIMQAGYTSDDEIDGWLDRLDRAVLVSADAALRESLPG